MPAMMPERLALTDPATQLVEVVGCGPFRFKADERVAGHRTVYERFEAYQPRETGTPDWTAGPKRVHFDRVVWTVMPDVSTASAALEKGEQDWWETVQTDLLPRLRQKRGITVSVIDPSGAYGMLRLNHLHPPFDNPAIRRALLGAVNQQDIVDVLAGPDAPMARADVGFFCPSSPMASAAGMEALTGARDLVRARRAIAEAGYDGKPVVALARADQSENRRMMEVVADVMRQIGLVVDLQTSDWGTMMQRYFKPEPVSQGGWNCLTFGVAGTDVWDPAINNYLRANGRGARPGWPNSPALEALRDRWLETADAGARQEIAAKIQIQAFEDVPYIPLGVHPFSTAYRSDLRGMLNGLAVFWNVRREG
jgi:peptide/nickel transport system substrate-binding protein